MNRSPAVGFAIGSNDLLALQAVSGTAFGLPFRAARNQPRTAIERAITGRWPAPGIYPAGHDPDAQFETKRSWFSENFCGAIAAGILANWGDQSPNILFTCLALSVVEARPGSPNAPCVMGLETYELYRDADNLC
jgi:hypothetical protein